MSKDEELAQLREKIADYVERVDEFHLHLRTNFEIKEKQPMCSDGKPHKGDDWTMDGCFNGFRCKRCNFTWLEDPIRPPKWKD